MTSNPNYYLQQTLPLLLLIVKKNRGQLSLSHTDTPVPLAFNIALVIDGKDRHRERLSLADTSLPPALPPHLHLTLLLLPVVKRQAVSFTDVSQPLCPVSYI